MSLFLDEDSRDIISNSKTDIIPIDKLTNHGYIGYYHYNILCEQELSKLYEFFNHHTHSSRKSIKRLKFEDADSANLLWSRLVTKFNKKFIHKNNKQYTATRIMPSMEIIQWPENIYFKQTFNTLTKDKYLQTDTTMYGTFIIPLIKTGCSTMFNEVGKEGIEIISCACSNSCSHANKCPCKDICVCDEPVTLHITEFVNFFYTSELSPTDIVGPARLNLYIHIEYKNK